MRHDRASEPRVYGVKMSGVSVLTKVKLHAKRISPNTAKMTTSVQRGLRFQFTTQC